MKFNTRFFTIFFILKCRRWISHPRVYNVFVSEGGENSNEKIVVRFYVNTELRWWKMRWKLVYNSDFSFFFCFLNYVSVGRANKGVLKDLIGNKNVYVWRGMTHIYYPDRSYNQSIDLLLSGIAIFRPGGVDLDYFRIDFNFWIYFFSLIGKCNENSNKFSLSLFSRKASKDHKNILTMKPKIVKICARIKVRLLCITFNYVFDTPQ